MLDAMLESIRHRGPDGGGRSVGAFPGLCFGMRRLSIIDVRGGDQPIWNEDGTVGVIFNGEIYNYVELRRRLAGGGHRFKTESDTEVLVHLYEDLGESCVRELQGMFAFAILDRRKERLFMARDPFGQKPFYYHERDGFLAFGSEIKALAAHPGVSLELSSEAFLDYAAWLSLPAPQTHFSAIRQLPPAHSFSFDLRKATLSEPVPYWRWETDAAPDLTDPEEAVALLDRVLDHSLNVHLRSDVPVGLLLSSGVDSATLASYSQQKLAGTLRTFTVDFSGDSEAAGARRIAEHIGAQHHELTLTSADFLEALPTVAWHLDEPIGDPAAFCIYRICRHARDHVKVLLGGEGADELFGGYAGRYRGMGRTLRRSDWIRPLRALLPHLSLESASRWARVCGRAHLTRDEEIIALRQEGLPGDVREPRGFTASQLERLARRRRCWARRLLTPQRDILHDCLQFDVRWQLPSSLLQKADKMSMAASMELRSPFLDLRIAEVAARIPSSMKLGKSGPGKLLLRECLRRRDAAFDHFPKKGFPVPITQWLLNELRGEAEHRIFRPSAAWRSHLDAGRLRAAWNDFQNRAWDGALFFYALWIYEEWREAIRDRYQGRSLATDSAVQTMP